MATKNKAVKEAPKSVVESPSANPFSDIEVVTLDDPAIDLEKSDITQYSKTRDLKHLTFKEGTHPIFFAIKRLPVSQYISIRNVRFNQILQEGLVFLYACQSYRQGSQTYKAEIDISTNMATDAWLTQIQDEIGAVALSELLFVAERLQNLSKRDSLFLH